ncbi:MAG: cation:proton antiporter [Candidatus Saccharimonas sp.]|nr:cation:proton antiporter [Planctomycetaceae bacterium]
MSTFDLSVRFFLQMAIILAACRFVGLFARRMGQPQVVAEMVAGVILGPSIFGLLLPETQQYFFPKESKVILFAVCQVGIALYMFLVGLEFRTDLFQLRLRSAASISIAGMLIPFVLGVAIALWLVQSSGEFFTERVKPFEGALFLGAAMCITAFPVLARIIVERGLAGTTLGTLSLAAGAMDDAAAWCLLAVVLASFESNLMIAVLTIGGSVAYALLTLTVVRWGLKPLGRMAEREGKVTPGMVSFALMLMMLGSWMTDAIGIHAVFGAFILGCAMPRGLFAREMTKQVEPLATGLLVPVFFTYSGLNTRLDLMATPNLWFVATVILLAACLGKVGGCWAAARLNGEDHRTSLAVGALMNARGLMELIILNIGLERGLITPELFSIMVVMAIVTTLMASPLLEWLYWGRTRGAVAVAAAT